MPLLALWGEDDVFAPSAGAYRFQKDILGAKSVAIQGACHFAFEDYAKRCAEEVVAFLAEAE